MARIISKPGDIFELMVNGEKRYVQFIYKDKSYLGGDLVRAFEIRNAPSVEAVVASPVLFYKHTFLAISQKFGWKRIGNHPIESDFIVPLFRVTTDTMAYVKKSHKWKLIQGDKEKFLGELPNQFRSLPFASVVSPVIIAQMITSGGDDSGYPE